MHFTYQGMLMGQLLLILALRFYSYVAAQTPECGTVNGSPESNRLLIRFAPSDYFKNNISRDHFRWVFGTKPIRQLNLTYKYQEAGYNLTITNLSSNDSGYYYVDCWTSGQTSGQTYQSGRWSFNYDYYIKASGNATSRTTSTSTSSKPPQETQTSATTVISATLATAPITAINDTITMSNEHDKVLASSNNVSNNVMQPLSQSTIIIVCVCVVLVALIAAGTVVVIRVKGKPSNPNELKSGHTTQEGTSKDGPPAESDHAYPTTHPICMPKYPLPPNKARAFGSCGVQKRSLPDVPTCEFPPSENPYADISLDGTTIEKTDDHNKPELQYADLDLATSSNDDNGPRTKPTCNTIDENTGKCQYATIDFETKAFVAPVRKAPSSWYKRKNKNRKDT